MSTDLIGTKEHEEPQAPIDEEFGGRFGLHGDRGFGCGLELRMSFCELLRFGSSFQLSQERGPGPFHAGVAILPLFLELFEALLLAVAGARTGRWTASTHWRRSLAYPRHPKKGKKGDDGSPKTRSRASEDVEWDLDEAFGQTEQGQVEVGDEDWGKTILSVVQDVLGPDRSPKLEQCRLYSLRVFPRQALVDVRLDRLDNKYGSPTMEDIETFSREFNARIDLAVQEHAVPDDISVEVSSPGANRSVQVPEALERFREVPMDVTYREESETFCQAFELVEVLSQEGFAVWKLADVRANRQHGGKGKPMNKKLRETRWKLSFEDTLEVATHLLVHLGTVLLLLESLERCSDTVASAESASGTFWRLSVVAAVPTHA
eukprot:jgi/Pico_ML_1/53949/g4405.t1